MLKLLVAGLLGGVALCAPAWAAQGEVCKSTGGDGSAASIPSNELTNSLMFTCEAAGNKTIPQLYTSGWRVVQYMPAMGAQPVADPRLPPRQGMVHLIIIEKI